MRHKAYGFKKSVCVALKGVTCCCLVSVWFFSTLISHKIFNLKTLEAYRTDRNRQSQLRAGFTAAAALSWGRGAWEKATFGKTHSSILVHFSLEQLLNSESILAPCAIVWREGRSPISYSLTSFAVVFFAQAGLRGGALDSHLGRYSLSNPKWKQEQRRCPAPRLTLPMPHVSSCCRTVKLEAFWPSPSCAFALQHPLNCWPPQQLTSFLLLLLHSPTSSTNNFVFSPVAHLCILLVMTSKPSSCLISASDCLLTASSVSTFLHMIQVYFNPMI